MTREQLTDTRWKIFCGLDSYMTAVCKGTEHFKQWKLWFDFVGSGIKEDEIIFLEGIKVFDEILSKLIKEEGTAEEVSGDEVDENEHKKCIMRLEVRKARKEKETINALQPCTDAISRQAVLNLAKFDGRDGLGSIIHAFDVEQLPPVTPAEKMGYWEWNQYDSTPNIGNYHCSQCHGIGKSYYDYCPNCGNYNGGGDNGNE